MHEDNKVVAIALILLAVVLIGILILVGGRKKSDDEIVIPKDYGKVEVDENGEEVLGDIEVEYYSENGDINLGLATFDKDEAESIKANKKIEVLYPEISDLDETIIKKKELYFLDKEGYEEDVKLNYLMSFLAYSLTESGEHGVSVSTQDDNTIVLNLSSSVYTGLMTKYFPLDSEDPSCTDFHVDQESANKSIHLLVQNLKLISKQLYKNELPKMKFNYSGVDTEIKGVVDKDGNIL